MSLQLGEDLFDVKPSYGTTLARPEDPVPEGDDVKGEGANPTTTFLCVPSQHERVLVTETAIAGQLSLVPASSTSKTHIELVKHVGAQHIKHSRMKILDDVHDAAELEIFHKKSLGPDFKPKAKKRTTTGSSGTRRQSRSRRDASEESGSDRGYAGSRARGSRAADWNDSDDGFVVDDDDDESEAQASDDEDEFETSRSKKKSKSRKRKGGDDDDVDEDDDDDPLARAERSIHREEKRRKRAKTQAKHVNRDFSDEDEDEDADGEPDEGGEAEMDMDVESEDD
jgi:RNA polymerase-associated protein LEO1